MADFFCGSVQYAAVAQWAATTAFSIGDIRRQLAAPTAGNERVFRCTTGGTSGGAEPSWNLGAGATTTDGTVTWTEITGSSTYNTLGGTWSAPFARMRTAASRMAAGDRLFVRNDHSATEAAAVTITFPGTLTSPNQVLGVDSAGALAVGANELTTGNSDIAVSGCLYIYGIRLDCGSGANSPGLRFGNSSGGSAEQIVSEDCYFAMNATGAFAFIYLRADGASKGDQRHIRPRFRLGSTTNQYVVLSGGEMRIQGGQILSGGSSPAALFSLNSARPVMIDGFDFSGFSASIDIFSGGFGGGKGILRNCKLPASWTGSMFNNPPASLERAEAYNCSDGDQNYKITVEDDRGTMREETTIVRTGGASDGTTPISWRIATTADASYPSRVFRSPEIFTRIDTVGSPVTITVDIIRDSITNLTNAEVWIEVQYLGNSGFPLSSFITDAKADVLASAADQTASSATWTTTGMANPNEQQLSVTFTPQEAGVAIVTICVARASTTLYADPVAQLS